MYSSNTATQQGTSEAAERAAAHSWVGLQGWIVPVLLMTLGAATRLLDITSKSLWLDEGFSIHVARLPYAEMIPTIINHDTPPPLYYSLLHMWMNLFGNSLFTARSLSAVMGIASVGIVYLIGMEVGGKRVAFTAALLMAISPFQVWYGQEVRMYALLGFLGVSSMYLLLRGLRRGSFATWVLFTLTAALALYTQISAAFLLAGELVAAALYLAIVWRQYGSGERPGGEVRKRAISVAISMSAAVLLWTPWLPAFLRQGQTYQRFWIDTPTASSLVTTFFEFTSAYLPHWRVPAGQQILLGLALLLVVVGLARLQRPEAAFLLAVTVVPIVAVYMTSQVKPVFLSRALIYSAAPYLVLMAAGISAIRRWQLGSVTLVLLLTLNVGSLYRIYMVEEKEEWNDATAYVLSHSAPAETVLFVAADAQLPFDYYADPESTNLVRRGLPVDVFSVGPLEPRVESSDLKRMDELVAGKASFWLIASHEEFADPDELVLSHARERYRLLDSREYEGIEVLRFGAPRASDQATTPSRIPSR